MKRCPQCNRVETDDSLGFLCLWRVIYAALGEKDKAFVELEEAYRQRDWRMSVHLKLDPLIESLRSDARYKIYSGE